MLPYSRTYRLIIDSKGRHGDEIYLTGSSDSDQFRFHSMGDEEHMTLPYMTIKEATSYFRKLADLLENIKMD